jgi:hypothetical protein
LAAVGHVRCISCPSSESFTTTSFHMLARQSLALDQLTSCHASSFALFDDVTLVLVSGSAPS